jgi:hypothetical protein
MPACGLPDYIGTSLQISAAGLLWWLHQNFVPLISNNAGRTQQQFQPCKQALPDIRYLLCIFLLAEINKNLELP